MVRWTHSANAGCLSPPHLAKGLLATLLLASVFFFLSDCCTHQTLNSCGFIVYSSHCEAHTERYCLHFFRRAHWRGKTCLILLRLTCIHCFKNMSVCVCSISDVACFHIFYNCACLDAIIWGWDGQCVYVSWRRWCVKISCLHFTYQVKKVVSACAHVSLAINFYHCNFIDRFLKHITVAFMSPSRPTVVRRLQMMSLHDLSDC